MAMSHGRKLYFAVSTPSAGAMAAISAYTMEVTGLPGEQDLNDITIAGNVGYSQYPGLQKASFSSKHIMDVSSTAITAWDKFAAFQSLQQSYPTTPWGIQFGPAGSTAALPLITCNAMIKSLSGPSKVTDVNTFTVNWEMSAGTSGITVGTVT